MKRILIVGCGDIAMRLAPLLHGRCRLFGLVRRTERCAEVRAAGITPLAGDLDDRASLARIAGLADTVLHFAPPAARSLRSSAVPTGGDNSAQPKVGGGLPAFGVPLAWASNNGTGDLRTRNLLAALSRSTPPRRLIYISTSGVYGDCGGAQVSETHRLNPQTVRAQLRVDAEQQIRDWAKRNHASASILRVPGIYAAERLPLERLRAGTPVIVAQEDSYTNLIHADDLAHIVVAALRHAKPNRVYHASDDSTLKMGDYFDAVADAHGMPRPPRLPSVEIGRSVSPALWSFMNESRRLTNERMKKELGVVLRYSTVADALQPRAVSA